MEMLRYDEEALVRSLSRLSPALRAVFAAACAQRLQPAYEAFWKASRRGDPARLASILERLWSHLRGEAIPGEQIGADLETVMSLIPKEDDEPWLEEQAYAEDAGASLAYALRALAGGQSQEAAWAARRAYEAVDHHLTHRAGLDPGRAGGEERLLRHPLMQAELARQKRDLEELLQAEAAGDTSVIERLRTRAAKEAGEVLG